MSKQRTNLQCVTCINNTNLNGKIQTLKPTAHKNYTPTHQTDRHQLFMINSMINSKHKSETSHRETHDKTERLF